MNLRRRTGLGTAAIVLALLMPVCTVTARAQDQPQQGGGEGGRGQFAGMQRIGGTITAVTGSQVTIKTVDGAVYQVVTTDNTRVMRGRGVPGKLADLKAGDGLMALGNLDAANKTMHAALVMSIEAEQMKQMEEAHQQELANLGKTLIAGRVTAIDLDNATMTVERPDGVSQTIGFDENTSFRRGRWMISGESRTGNRGAQASNHPAAAPGGESITLADIKVGDRVSGPGGMKNGQFVAKELNVMTPGAGRRRDGETGAPAGEATGAAQQPGSPAPK
jgi:hypothetical protein